MLTTILLIIAGEERGRRLQLAEDSVELFIGTVRQLAPSHDVKVTRDEATNEVVVTVT